MGKVYQFKEHVEKRRGYDPKKPLRKKGGQVVAFDLSALAKKTRHREVQIDDMDEPLGFDYTPHRVTTNWVSKMETADEKGNIRLMAEGAAEIMTGWDAVIPKQKMQDTPIVGDDGEPTGETMQEPAFTSSGEPIFDRDDDGNVKMVPAPLSADVLADTSLMLLNGIFGIVMSDMQSSTPGGGGGNPA